MNTPFMEGRISPLTPTSLKIDGDVTLVSYMILAHSATEQLRLLISTILAEPRSRVYLHFDSRSELASWFDEFGPRFKLVERAAVNWGGFSQFSAMRRLVEASLMSTDNNTFVLPSGTCFPVLSMKKINDYLDVHGGITVFSLWRVISDPVSRLRVQASDSVEKYHYLDFAWVNPSRGKPQRVFWRLIDRVNALLPYRRFVNLKIVKGSSWFAAGRVVATEIIKRNPEYERFFRFTKSPDETYMQTLYYQGACARGESISFTEETNNIQGLHYIGYKNLKRRSIIDRFIRHVDRRILTVDSVDTIISSPAMFARKCTLEVAQSLLTHANSDVPVIKR